jgi:hypothetical protein
MILLAKKNKPLSDQSNKQGWRELARYRRSILTAMVPDTRAEAATSVNASIYASTTNILPVKFECR